MFCCYVVCMCVCVYSLKCFKSGITSYLHFVLRQKLYLHAGLFVPPLPVVFLRHFSLIAILSFSYFHMFFPLSIVYMTSVQRQVKLILKQKFQHHTSLLFLATALIFFKEIVYNIKVSSFSIL